MNYAIIENDAVANIIVGPLPDGMEGVAIFDRPVAIGNTFYEGGFLRNGEPVLTDAERIAAMEARVAEIALQN